MQMNIEERLAKYLKRDFSLEQAQILVLMEEVAIALFAALPEHFVLFGGATLVLFHNSPRLSKDLDLLARVDSLPSSGELQSAMEERVQEVATIFGHGRLDAHRRFGACTGNRRRNDHARREHGVHPKRFHEISTVAKGGNLCLAKNGEDPRSI